MGQRRITVSTQFGEKEVAKHEFVDRWDNHAKQLLYVASSPETLKELESMRERVEALASEKFEELYQKQRPERGVVS